MDKSASDTASLATPVWDYSDRHFFGHLIDVVFRESMALFVRLFVYRGNKVAYLRHLGVTIGRNCDLLNSIKDFGTEPWLIEIGNRVTVTHGVVLLTHDGANRVFRDRLPGSSVFGNRFGIIRILDNCFVGVNAIIMPGVTIGPDSIIGAGSVVTDDVPPRTVAAGVPARTICTLDEYVERYKSKMIPLAARNRAELRAELTRSLWGETR